MTCYHDPIHYIGADYERFINPSDRVLGLEAWHHYGFLAVPLLAGETVEQAAYRHVREKHYFLTDDNHTWEIVTGEKPWWRSRVRVIKNEKSTRFVWAQADQQRPSKRGQKRARDLRSFAQSADYRARAPFERWPDLVLEEAA